MFSKSSLRDRLTVTTDEGKIELTEQELSRVSGGLKIKLQEVLISSVSTGGSGGEDRLVNAPKGILPPLGVSN